MTDERRRQFGLALDGIADAFREDVPEADSNIELIIYGLVDLVENDRKQQTHPLVESCLEGCVEMLRHAAFAYYASFK